MVLQYLILNFTFLSSLFFVITEAPKKETLAQVFSCFFNVTFSGETILI